MRRASYFHKKYFYMRMHYAAIYGEKSVNLLNIKKSAKTLEFADIL